MIWLKKNLILVLVLCTLVITLFNFGYVAWPKMSDAFVEWRLDVARSEAEEKWHLSREERFRIFQELTK